MKSMEYKYKLSDTAKEELEEIYNYISQVLKEPQIAKRMIEKISQGIGTLKISPYLYVEIQTKRQKEPYRRLIIGKYIVLYSIDEEKKEILIFRIFYGKRDYLAIND